ncbi:MAG: threonine synthase, partial [Sphaerochaetaceae bacterium]
YEVVGTFDDCQKMVKDAFMDQKLSEEWGLSSANSINLGRLLPQAVYYVYASLVFRATHDGHEPVIIVPSGNVGNCCGAYWAKLMGSPIERIALAVNANATIPDYLDNGIYRPRQSVATLANAMDVGAPSNMERLFHLFPTIDLFRREVSAWSVDDGTIRRTIKEVWDDSRYAICPHTATAERVRRDHFADAYSLVVSTAHPAKFESVVEPLIRTEVEIPGNLAALLEKPTSYTEVGVDYHLIF